VSPDTRKGNGNGNGNGNGGSGSGGGGGFDDFDDFIRDRDEAFEETFDNPRAGYDPYEDFAGAKSGPRQAPGFDRGLVDAITRILEGLGGVTGDALSPDARRKLEKALRDLLIVLRDVINAMIERIDNRREDDFEIEEIPID
jgi:plasmid stabilization system protein ParE